MNTKEIIANTSVSQGIDMTEGKANYDECAKRLLSNRVILAWILKYTTKELFEYSIAEIQTMIEEEPEIGVVQVAPGLTNKQKINGLGTESKIPNEGEVTFDIRFYVKIPDKRTAEKNKKTHPQTIKLIINVEAQNHFSPGYSIPERGIFYAARMISAQLDTEFEIPNYSDIKKVNSIWICPNAPDYAKNTIVSYEMQIKNIVGCYPENRIPRYDLLNITVIGLGKDDTDGESKLTKMLHILLSNRLSTAEKKCKLESEYHIPMTRKLEKEMIVMCNLSEGIEQSGIQKGIQQGMEIRNISLIRKMKGCGYTIEEIANLIDREESDIMKISALYEKHPDWKEEDIYLRLHSQSANVLSSSI